MKGTIIHLGKQYDWHSGDSVPEAARDYFVHCWHEDYGLTRYFYTMPNEEDTVSTAKKLAAFLEIFN